MKGESGERVGGECDIYYSLIYANAFCDDSDLKCIGGQGSPGLRYSLQVHWTLGLVLFFFTAIRIVLIQLLAAKPNKLLCPRGTQTCALAVANIRVNGNGKVILHGYASGIRSAPKLNLF